MCCFYDKTVILSKTISGELWEKISTIMMTYWENVEDILRVKRITYSLCERYSFCVVLLLLRHSRHINGFDSIILQISVDIRIIEIRPNRPQSRCTVHNPLIPGRNLVLHLTHFRSTFFFFFVHTRKRTVYTNAL